MMCLHINRATMSYIVTIHFPAIFVLAFWEHHWIDTYWVEESRNSMALGLELCVPQTSFEILSFSPHLQNHGTDEDRTSRIENFWITHASQTAQTNRLAATLPETNIPVLLMEEILHQLECIKPCIFFNDGVNYQPQMVNTGFLNHQQ